MKKRLLAFLLAVLMCLTLFPFATLADDSDAYEAYYSLLCEHRADIERYYDIQSTPVAICDICGDSTPELLFVERQTSDSVYTTLNIYTYKHGSVRLLLSEQWDFYAGKGLNYCFFKIMGDNALYALTSSGEWDYSVERVLKYKEDGSGGLRASTQFKCETEIDPQYYWNSSSTYYYSSGDYMIQTSKSDYDSKLHDFIYKINDVVMRSGSFTGTVYEAIKYAENNYGCDAMTVDEALEYLEEHFSDTPAYTGWKTAFEDYVYYEEFRDHGFFGEENYYPVTFALHDFEDDGVPELIVRNGCDYEADAHSNVYRFDGSEVSYIGTAGFRLGMSFMYSNDSAYTGLFWQNGHMGDYPMRYYYVDSYGRMNYETVYNDDGDGTISRETYDIDLYYAALNATDTMPEYTYNEVMQMGWDSFCEKYVSSGSPYVRPSEHDEDPFDDVPKYLNGELNPFYDAINWAASNGITLGYDDNTFRPNNPCTRGHVVTFLWRYAGQPKANFEYSTFSDIDRDAYYYDAVMWAIENGITTGYEDGTFRPNAQCTRAHVVTFLWRLNGCPDTEEEETQVLSDLGGLSSSFVRAITAATVSGITTGYSDGTFRPHNVCTRAHVVTFLWRNLTKG